MFILLYSGVKYLVFFMARGITLYVLLLYYSMSFRQQEITQKKDRTQFYPDCVMDHAAYKYIHCQYCNMVYIRTTLPPVFMRRCARCISEKVTHPSHSINSFAAVTHMQERMHKVPKSASQAVLSRMQITLHATRPTPHGASRLVQAMAACSLRTRRAPSRHCRDARVYGNTTQPYMTMSTPLPSTKKKEMINQRTYTGF